jgi:hypothetical protein
VDLAIAYVAVGIFAATVTHFTIGTHMLKAPDSKPADSNLSSSRWASGAGATAAAAALAGKKQEELPLMIEMPLASSKSMQLQNGSDSSGDYLLSARAAAAVDSRDSIQQICSGCGADGGSLRGCSNCGVQQCLQCGQHVVAGVPAEEQQQQQQQQLKPVAARHTVLAGDANCNAAATLVSLQHHPSCSHHRQSGEQQQQQQCSTPEPSVLSDAQLHQAAGSTNNQQQQQQQACDWAAGERESLLGPGISSSDSACWVQLDLREKQQLPMQQPQHQQRSSSSWWSFASNNTCRSSSSSGSGRRARLHAAGAAAGGFLWSLASPPLVGCMLAVGVGMLLLLRNQLFSPEGHLLLIEVGLDCVLVPALVPAQV